jgi:hypothetical protein
MEEDQRYPPRTRSLEGSVTPAELQFPVLVINGFGIPWSYSSVSRLLSCHARGLKRGRYRGARIFDMAGNALVVGDAHRVRTLWRHLDLEVLLFNLPIEVSLEVESEMHGVTVKDIKRELCSMIDKDNSDLSESHAEEKAVIRRLRTIEEAIRRYLPGQEFGVGY